jgi:hypothetical protein
MNHELNLTLIQIRKCANETAEAIRDGKCDEALALVREAQVLWQHVATNKRDESTR